MVEKDNLPLRLLPALKRKFPWIIFIELDPTENFKTSSKNPLVIIDTVVGIDKVTLFKNLDFFANQNTVTAHDYSLIFHLKFLKKLGGIPRDVWIIGIPQI